jgi:hypothetical protein
LIQEWDFRKFERERNEREGRFIGMCLGGLALMYLGACVPLDPGATAAQTAPAEKMVCVTGGLGSASSDTAAPAKASCTDTLHLPTHGARS